MEELFKILNIAKLSLDNYYEKHKIFDFSDNKNSPADYLKWIDTKTKIILNSQSFLKKSKEYIVRGDVVWVEFGFNIGEEISI